MLMTSSDNVPGREIEETIGLVTANAVRSRHIGRDILASFKNIIGGEIGAYTQLLRESREQAFAELTATAEAEGADAIVGVRMATSAIASGAAEILVYGTAVRLAS